MIESNPQFDSTKSPNEGWMKTPKFDSYLKASVASIEDKNRRKPLSKKVEFYVYVLMDSRYPGPHEYKFLDKRLVLPFRPFYVGKGKGDRIYTHLREVRTSKKKNHKLNLMRKIVREGYQVKGRIMCELTDEATAFAKERCLINLFPNLTNLTEGGEGVAGPKSEEHKKKISDALKGRPRSWKTTLETRAKLSASKLGVKQTPAHRAANSASKKGRPGKKHTEEAKAKMREACKNRMPRKWTEEQKQERSALYAGRFLRPKWTEEQKEARSALIRAKWADPKYRAAQIAKQNAGKARARLVG